MDGVVGCLGVAELWSRNEKIKLVGTLETKISSVLNGKKYEDLSN